jgi:glycosyl transferase family 25
MPTEHLSIPICFINLASDEQRCERMQAEFLRHGLVGHRLDAVRWTDLTPQAQDELYSDSLNEKQFHVSLVAGEKGCYASHHKAWAGMVENGLPAMVVLEDDVRLTPELTKVIAAVETLEIPWDMIKLIGRDKEKIRARRPLVEGVDLIDYKRVPSLTAGYIISREGALKLMRKRKPFGRPIDVDLRFWWECDLRIMGVSPACLILDDTSFTSTIGQKNRQRTWRAQWNKFSVKFSMTLLNELHTHRRGAILGD